VLAAPLRAICNGGARQTCIENSRKAALYYVNQTRTRVIRHGNTARAREHEHVRGGQMGRQILNELR
jgi:hypothetical protein